MNEKEAENGGLLKKEFSIVLNSSHDWSIDPRQVSHFKLNLSPLSRRCRGKLYDAWSDFRPKI